MCHSALRTIAAAAAAAVDAVVDLPKPSDRQAARRGCRSHQQQPPAQHQAVEHTHEAIVAFPIPTPEPEKNDEGAVTYGTYQSTRIAPQDIQSVMTGDRLIDAFEALEAVCTWNSSVFASHAAIDKMHAPPAAEPLSTFHSGRVPALTLWELARVMQHSTKCEDAQLWMALVLFVRACAAGDDVVPSCHSMHRLYVAALHVAMKVHSDRFLSNGYYAMLAGVSSAEMNQLEAALVQAAGWHLLVTSDDIAAVALSPPDYVKGLRRADVLNVATRDATPAAKRPAAAVPVKKATSPGSRGSVFLMTAEGCSPQSNVNNNTTTELSSNPSSAFASYCCTPPGTPAFCGAAASPLTSAEVSSSPRRRNARHEDALDAAGLK